jgi:YD repeat-containing protein
MKFKHVSLVLLFLVQIAVTSAQTPIFQSPSIVSPQSASLIKSIEYPVDYTRGLVNISIPLYSIKVNDIEVPIVLSYHPSGNKVFDMSGWVGLGWSLSAEPSVTRSVAGNPDENGFLTSTLLGTNTNDYLDPLSKGTYDEVPDQFYYSMPDKQGSFFFSRTPGVSGYTLKTLPFEPLQISKLSPTLNTQIVGFKIVDEGGKQYYFGNTQIEKDNLLVATAWKGTMIVSSNIKDTVFFKYSPAAQESIISEDSQTITIEDKSNLTPGDELATNVGTPAYDEQLTKPFVQILKNGALKKYWYDPSQQKLVYIADNNNPGLPAVVSSMSTLYTQEVDFRGGKVVFDIESRTHLQGAQISDNGHYLNKITVYNSLGTIIKVIQFHYVENQSSGDHPQNSTPLYESRLFLTSLEIAGGSTAVPEKYSFNYETTQLPNHFTYDVDYWGYYNYNSSAAQPVHNQSLIPPTTIAANQTGHADVNLTLGDANRSPYFLSTRAGVLTEIDYPTGGSTTFGYEANQAYNASTNSNTPVGGLRIQYITDYDPVTNAKKIRYFKYGINENGGGYVRHWLGGGMYDPYLIQQNKYLHIPIWRYHLQTNQWSFDAAQVLSSRFRTISSNPVADIFYKGAAVAYPQVTEYQGSPSDANFSYQGKTIHTFSFTAMGSNGGYTTPYFISGTSLPYDTKADWGYGTPLVSLQSKNDGNNTAVQSKIDYYNVAYQPQTIWSRSVFKSTVGVGDFTQYPDILSNEVFQTQVNAYQSGYNQLTADTTKEYTPDGTNPVITVHSYTYGNPNITDPTQISSVNSDGTTKLIKNYYVHDMVALGKTVPYQAMITNNIIAPIISSESYTNGVLQMTTTNNYSQNWPANANLMLLNNVTSKYKTLTEEQRVLVNGYDDKGNLLSVSRDGKPQAYQWGYNQLYPVAVVTNALNTNIFFDGFEEGNGNSGTGYARTGHYGFTGSYSKSLTGFTPGYYTLTYWSKSASTNLWSLVTNSQVQVSSSGNYTISINGQIDDVRFYPAGAQMTTYTYDPLIGMTSMTDAKSQITYYEYDALLRLKNIRDMNGNILKNYCYNYASQPMDGCPVNLGNSVQSQAYNKACSPGSSGSLVTYTVPANTYFALDTATANQMARSDLAKNGQNYANSNGTCSVIAAPYIVISQASSIVDANGHTQNTYTFTAYADASHTTPFSVPANLTINYKITTTVTHSSGSPAPATTSTNQTVVISSGSNFVTTAQTDVYHCTGGSTPSVVQQNAAAQTNSAVANPNVVQPGDTICTSSSLTLLAGTGYQIGGGVE